MQQPAGGTLTSFDPSDGSPIADVLMAAEEDYDEVVHNAHQTFLRWRMIPAPKRGLIVREIGDELRAAKQELGALVSIETGKILQEGVGEVQEMIDIADFAVGLSRQLYGLTMHSERPMHRMYEQWHPLGVVGIISAFNFPVAVWSWNALIAAVCGDCVVWKPSPETPLTAIAVQKICNRVMERNGWEGVFNLTVGGVEAVGERMLVDRRIVLISATGSTAMGKRVAEVAGEATGTHSPGTRRQQWRDRHAGRRPEHGGPRRAFRGRRNCRPTMHEYSTAFCPRLVHATVTDRLVAAYEQVRIGSPLDPGTLWGRSSMSGRWSECRRRCDGRWNKAEQLYMAARRSEVVSLNPRWCSLPPEMPLLQYEVFAPILYLIAFNELDQVIGWHNNVPQGLSSAIFTNNARSAETFLSVRGSDCGIANVNIGTSGAEIGGAFGGEKETGGGRESGSDAWKVYMRRQTVTINWSNELPLAQGIDFPLLGLIPYE